MCAAFGFRLDLCLFIPKDLSISNIKRVTVGGLCVTAAISSHILENCTVSEGCRYLKQLLLVLPQAFCQKCSSGHIEFARHYDKIVGDYI